MDKTQILDILNSNPSTSDIINLMKSLFFEKSVLDFNFYKNFYTDLTDYSDYELLKHYYYYGIEENRIPNREIFSKLYPDFVLDEYRSIYSKECYKKNEYQIFYDYSLNFKKNYSNFNLLKQDLLNHDLNFHYIFNKNTFDDINFFEICLDKINDYKQDVEKFKFKEDYNKNFKKNFEINKILDCNKNFYELQVYLNQKKKSTKNLIFDKLSFYKAYPDFDYIFYSKQIFVEDNDNLELYCINYFLKYGLIEKHFINEQVFTEFFYLKNLGENWLEIYKMSLKSKECTYIILNNYEGGSYKFFIDLVCEYRNNYFKVIKNNTHLKNINFKENDKIFIQNLDGFTFNDLVEIKQRFKVKIFIHLSDFNWLSKNLDIKSEENYKNYLDVISIDADTLNFMNSCNNLICPSNFVFQIYSKFKLKNLIQVDNNDFDFDNGITRVKVKEEAINLGVLTTNNVQKGKNIYDILKRIYHNKYHNGFKINFLTIGDEISSYEEKEFFDILIKHNINSLLYLNSYGDTWSYCLSKGLKSGLPILYNNIGSFADRIKPNHKNYILFDDEKQISRFTEHNYNQNILSKFENFLNITLSNSMNAQVEIYKNDIDFSLKTNIFYDSFFKRNLPVSYIDFYAIYDTSIRNYNNYHLEGLAIKYNSDNENINEIFENNLNFKLFLITSSENLNNIDYFIELFNRDNYLKIDNLPVLFIESSGDDVEDFKRTLIQKCKDYNLLGCKIILNDNNLKTNEKYYSDKVFETSDEINKFIVNSNKIQTITYNENLTNDDFKKIFLKLCANYKKNEDKINKMFLIDCNNSSYFLGLIKSMYTNSLKF